MLTKIFQKKEFNYYFLKKNFTRTEKGHYKERPVATFCNVKHIVLNDFCLACYTLGNKSSKTSEYHLGELDDSSIENNHERRVLLPPTIRLKISKKAKSCKFNFYVILQKISILMELEKDT